MMTSHEFLPASSPVPRGVRRVLDAMRANLGRNWRLTDLAAIAGTSGRTLQRQFLSFVGKTPRAALREIGLECARRELLQGTPGLRIMDVALDCGFPHFGRFSIAYRHRFGETPSQTLARQTAFADSLDGTPALLMPARDRPVMAFGPVEASPENREMAADLADQLVAALTRAGISVVTGTRAAPHLLTAAIRGSGVHTQLIVRLIDTETGRQLWAHRADGLSRDETATSEHLAVRIAAALQPCLRLAEIDHALRKPTVCLGAYDLALRAMPGVLSLDASGNGRALELLDRALQIEPDHPLATALAAWAHVQRVVYHFTTEAAQERARSLALVHKARTLCNDATVLAILGNALSLLNEFDAADLVTRKALTIDGGSAWAWSRSGWIDVYKGDPQSAIERFKIALDLAPHDPLAFNSTVGIGCALFTTGQYAEGARWQERALAEHPSASWVHRTLCPAYVLAGQARQAQRSLVALRQHYPDLTVPEVQRGMPPLPASQCDLVVGALQEAGLPG